MGNKPINKKWGEGIKIQNQDEEGGGGGGGWGGGGKKKRQVEL